MARWPLVALPLLQLLVLLLLVQQQVRGLDAAPNGLAEQDMMAVTVSAGPIAVMETPLSAQFSASPSDQVRILK